MRAEIRERGGLFLSTLLLYKSCLPLFSLLRSPSYRLSSALSLLCPPCFVVDDFILATRLFGSFTIVLSCWCGLLPFISESWLLTCDSVIHEVAIVLHPSFDFVLKSFYFG